MFGSSKFLFPSNLLNTHVQVTLYNWILRYYQKLNSMSKLNAVVFSWNTLNDFLKITKHNKKLDFRYVQSFQALQWMFLWNKSLF